MSVILLVSVRKNIEEILRQDLRKLWSDQVLVDSGC